MRLLLVAAIVLSSGLARADVAGVPLPRGSRAEKGSAEPVRHASGKGYRDTVDHMRKWLSKEGVAHRQVGPYRARGVDVTRFLSEDPSTAWLAVHVVRQAGKTWISVVKRPP